MNGLSINRTDTADDGSADAWRSARGNCKSRRSSEGKLRAAKETKREREIAREEERREQRCRQRWRTVPPGRLHLAMHHSTGRSESKDDRFESARARTPEAEEDGGAAVSAFYGGIKLLLNDARRVLRTGC
jgi:hypothetical protein